MSEHFQKSKEEIALELFIYLTSGQVKHGIEYKSTSFQSPYQEGGNEAILYRGKQYLEVFKECLNKVKGE